ncbi:MAG TPA: SDR family oxidoreductase [Armatimonadota bacterium]|jgi:NAD(P)-dependent dehydrogenase (short-subunit alcohol dehydrogenase family)
MKVWFITGTSRGFGREWALAALRRGDKVAATARHTDTLEDLVHEFGDSVLPLQLDVTDRAADFAGVQRAAEHFGRLDVVVNNAGYGLFGAVEEVSEAEARAQLETNLFGALWVTQAALPIMRGQGSGHILQVSSIGGIAAFPAVGLYHASKWALEGFSDAMSQEVAQFGIKVTIIEPGGFETDWAGSSAAHAVENPVYNTIRNSRPSTNSKRGDPKASAEAILKVVDSEDPPLRLLLGAFASNYVKDLYPKRLATWAAWDAVSIAADGE